MPLLVLQKLPDMSEEVPDLVEVFPPSSELARKIEAIASRWSSKSSPLTMRRGRVRINALSTTSWLRARMRLQWEISTMNSRSRMLARLLQISIGGCRHQSSYLKSLTLLTKLLTETSIWLKSSKIIREMAAFIWIMQMTEMKWGWEHLWTKSLWVTTNNFL